MHLIGAPKKFRHTKLAGDGVNGVIADAWAGAAAFAAGGNP